MGLRQNVNGDTVLRVPGPEKEKEDNGDESLERTDLQSLLVQGCMLTCFVTNGFFNLLSKRLYEEGCRRVHSTVLVELLRRRRENGEQSLEHFDFGSLLPDGGCNDEDVRTAQLVFIPVFCGPIEAGHWALLVIDRTKYKPGVAVYFDSLPAYNPDMYGQARSVLQLCGLSGLTWIKADMPKQGSGTNDCGVWMSCVASIYARSVLTPAVVPSQSQTVPFRNGEKEFGLAGREHLTESLLDLSIDMSSDLFALAHLTFSN
jgi:hypothetical protein